MNSLGAVPGFSMGRHTASVIVLAGGAGTRIRHLYPDRPKPLIPVAGRPFIDWICRYWAAQGISRAVISLGHMAEAAEQHLSETSYPGMEVRCVREESPLGTGGAIRLAATSSFCSDPFIVVNGDSLVFAEISGVWPVLAREDVDGILLAVDVPDASRFGSLDVSSDGRLVGFREKRPGRGTINAGVYFLKKRVLPSFADSIPLSMELDVFPAMIATGVRLHVCPVRAEFLDMGTPEGLEHADAFIRRHLDELGTTEPQQ